MSRVFFWIYFFKKRYFFFKLTDKPFNFALFRTYNVNFGHLIAKYNNRIQQPDKSIKWVIKQVTLSSHQIFVEIILFLCLSPKRPHNQAIHEQFSWIRPEFRCQFTKNNIQTLQILNFYRHQIMPDVKSFAAIFWAHFFHHRFDGHAGLDGVML